MLVGLQGSGKTTTCTKVNHLSFNEHVLSENKHKYQILKFSVVELNKTIMINVYPQCTSCRIMQYGMSGTVYATVMYRYVLTDFSI